MQNLPNSAAWDGAAIERLSVNLRRILERLEAASARAHRPAGSVRLLAVTKSADAGMVEALARLGVADVGENRVKDAIEKAAAVRERVRWHLIGHLQTNKVRKALGLFEVIHSIDSVHLARAVDVEALARGVEPSVMLEVNMSGEASKGGFSPDALRERLPSLLSSLRAIRPIGLMTMAKVSEDPEASRPVFRALRELRDSLAGIAPLPELSMGMTQDYGVAVEEGATWVRIGSALYEGIERPR